MRILVFGDSTAQGYYDLEMGGWVNLLFVDGLQLKVRNPKMKTEIFNVSISGDTTRRIITRVVAEIESRKWQDEPVALVFAVGVNDAMLSNGKPISSPEQYVAELTELYDLVRPLSKELVFVGPESVDEADSAPWKYSSGTNELIWRNERVQLFDDALRGFCEDKGAHYVSIFDAFRARQQKGESLHEDGLHPNAAGHRLMYELIRPAIGALKD